MKVIILLGALLLAGCTEDLGARLERECMSILEAAYEAEDRPLRAKPEKVNGWTEVNPGLTARAKSDLADCIMRRGGAR